MDIWSKDLLTSQIASREMHDFADILNFHSNMLLLVDSRTGAAEEGSDC